MKTMAMILALTFAAPLAASAAGSLTPHDRLVQKIEATYHTSFPGGRG